LSDGTINEVMAKVCDGDRSDLETLGFAHRDMARLRDAHLKKTIVHITGRDIRSLGNRKVFNVTKDYGVEVIMPDRRQSKTN
jgi:hypothetical protein